MAAPEELRSTTWYLYNCEGNVERVVRHATGTESFTAVRLVYRKNDRTVTFIAEESWNAADTNPQTAISNYAVTALREYRYDRGRARYMTRKYRASRVMANKPLPVSVVRDGAEPRTQGTHG